MYLAEEESHAAFKKHFEEELQLYKQVCIVNLVEQQGRERIIWEAYGNHVLKYNSPDIIYATFDFHEYWLVTSEHIFITYRVSRKLRIIL